MPISPHLRYILYYVVQIPSVTCSFFVLFHLLSDRRLRHALNNHAIILILILGLIFALTDVVWLIHYYRIRFALISSPTFCLLWVYMDVAGFITISILVAWASVERHILIFHDRWVGTARGRLCMHYLPLIFFLCYPLVFYAFIFFYVACDEPLDYTIIRCGYSYCAIQQPTIGWFDSVVNSIIPIGCIVLASLLLLLRIVWQKHRLRQRLRWRNYRRMAIQLFSISGIYICFYFPPTIFYILYTAGVPLNSSSLDYYGSSLYFTSHIVMMIPFVSAASLPELRAKFRLNCR